MNIYLVPRPREFTGTIPPFLGQAWPIGETPPSTSPYGGQANFIDLESVLAFTLQILGQEAETANVRCGRKVSVTLQWPCLRPLIQPCDSLICKF